MPFPRSHVLPPNWEAHHQPVTESAMTAHCRVQQTPSGHLAFDAQSGRSVYPDPTPIYVGPCRVTRTVANRLTGDVGAKETPEAGYLLAIPLSGPELPVGAVVLIEAATDGKFVGTRLTVTAAHGGSLTWQRTYACTEWTPTVR